MLINFLGSRGIKAKQWDISEKYFGTIFLMSYVDICQTGAACFLLGTGNF